MTEKYGVVTLPPPVKQADAESVPRCPRCNTPLEVLKTENASNVLRCPCCGTAPFEE